MPSIFRLSKWRTKLRMCWWVVHLCTWACYGRRCLCRYVVQYSFTFIWLQGLDFSFIFKQRRKNNKAQPTKQFSSLSSCTFGWKWKFINRGICWSIRYHPWFMGWYMRQQFWYPWCSRHLHHAWFSYSNRSFSKKFCIWFVWHCTIWIQFYVKQFGLLWIWNVYFSLSTYWWSDGWLWCFSNCRSQVCKK